MQIMFFSPSKIELKINNKSGKISKYLEIKYHLFEINHGSKKKPKGQLEIYHELNENENTEYSCSWYLMGRQRHSCSTEELQKEKTSMSSAFAFGNQETPGKEHSTCDSRNPRCGEKCAEC